MKHLETITDFELPATGGQRFILSAMKSAPLVLYFYPKDDTPGCTDEGLQFTTLYHEFAKLKCTILGISRDSIASHDKFRAKMNFPFHLLSDSGEVACKIFDVIRPKTMYGKQVMGIQRSTFLINPNNELWAEWRGVSVPGHAQEVLDTLTQLTNEKNQSPK